MSVISVKVSRGNGLYRFSLLPASPTIKFPTFQSLCQALVHHLHLPTTASVLADFSRTPFHIFLLGNDKSHRRLLDDLSFREALRLSEKKHRITLYVVSRPGVAEFKEEEMVLADDVQAGIDDEGQCNPPVYVFSPTSLVKLLKSLRDDGCSSVNGALKALQRSVQCHNGDARTLRRRRHDLAGLFSVFLARAALPGSSRIPKSVAAPLMDNLRAALQGAGVSKHTTDAAVRAVKVVCNCKPTLALLKSRYADAVCKAASRKAEAEAAAEDASSSFSKNAMPGASMATAEMPAAIRAPDVLPVKHYLNQFRRMRHAAGPEVQEAYRRFEHARRRAGDMFPFELNRKLCRSLQRAVFHFLRCHVAARDHEFETAVRALASSVVRKLLRAGFDRRLVDVTMELVAAMATDEAVINLAYSAANAEMAEALIGEAVIDQVEDAEDLDDSGELEAMAEAAEEGMMMAASRKSHSNSASRPQSIHEPGGEYGSNESLDSFDLLHDEEEVAPPMTMGMNQISPVHSSEDLSPDGGIYGGQSGDEKSTSTDTVRSQWARVEREREREREGKKVLRRKERRLDRERRETQMAQQEIDLVSVGRNEEEDEIERKTERLSHASLRRSREPSRADSLRRSGWSVLVGGVPLREESLRGSAPIFQSRRDMNSSPPHVDRSDAKTGVKVIIDGQSVGRWHRKGTADDKICRSHKVQLALKYFKDQGVKAEAVIPEDLVLVKKQPRDKYKKKWNLPEYMKHKTKPRVLADDPKMLINLSEAGEVFLSRFDIHDDYVVLALARAQEARGKVFILSDDRFEDEISNGDPGGHIDFLATKRRLKFYFKGDQFNLTRASKKLFESEA